MGSSPAIGAPADVRARPLNRRSFEAWVRSTRHRASRSRTSSRAVNQSEFGRLVRRCWQHSDARSQELLVAGASLDSALTAGHHPAFGRRWPRRCPLPVRQIQPINLNGPPNPPAFPRHIQGAGRVRGVYPVTGIHWIALFRIHARSGRSHGLESALRHYPARSSSLGLPRSPRSIACRCHRIWSVWFTRFDATPLDAAPGLQ
jgi:hypothetical protein